MGLPSLPPTARPTELDVLEREAVEAVFELQPGYAVFLGLHGYDGRLPDLTTAATDRWLSTARSLRARLESVAPESLSPDRRFDRTLLGLLLESPMFDLEETHELERNPMAYIGQVSLTPYLVRNYAPASKRVEAMLRLLEATPTFLDRGMDRLGPELPKPYVQLALTIGDGLASHLQEAQSFADGATPGTRREFQAVHDVVSQSIQTFSDRLRSEFLPRASDDFALGPERYQRLLWVREGIRTPFAEVLREGWDDLRRNQSRLSAIARARSPPVSEAQLLESMFQRHVRAEQLIPKAAELVEEVREFVQNKRLVTIPRDSACRVEETPSYGRALSTASMNPPGPFDPPNESGIYYITPVDPAWRPPSQEEWLRLFNDATLRNTTVHEVFPGHFVQFLHFRSSSTSLARKAYISSAFAEGWAHYAEQVAVESGIEAQDRDAEVAQLHDALLRDCRLIASIGLHTQGMSVDAAAKLFRDEAHLEQLPAEREAIRGTFNPEYFCYTLGKLAILDVRRRSLQSKFRGELQAFHDRLLSFGAPPVGFLPALIEESG